MYKRQGSINEAPTKKIPYFDFEVPTALPGVDPKILDPVSYTHLDVYKRQQLTGTIFSNLSAVFGNEISTFPDYPAEVRAPQGTLSGVSGFQVHLGSRKIFTPGDKADVLVAMNPAALKVNVKHLKTNAIVLIDTRCV